MSVRKMWIVECLYEVLANVFNDPTIQAFRSPGDILNFF